MFQQKIFFAHIVERLWQQGVGVEFVHSVGGVFELVVEVAQEGAAVDLGAAVFELDEAGAALAQAPAEAAQGGDFVAFDVDFEEVDVGDGAFGAEAIQGAGGDGDFFARGVDAIGGLEGVTLVQGVEGGVAGGKPDVGSAVVVAGSGADDFGVGRQFGAQFFGGGGQRFPGVDFSPGAVRCCAASSDQSPTLAPMSKTTCACGRNWRMSQSSPLVAGWQLQSLW